MAVANSSNLDDHADSLQNRQDIGPQLPPRTTDSTSRKSWWLNVRKRVLKLPLAWRMVRFFDTVLLNPDRQFKKLIEQNYQYDKERFSRFSGTIPSQTSPTQLRARITKTYHRIEKALALPTPRPGFGHEVVSELIGLLERYVVDAGFDDTAVTAINTLTEYFAFQSENGSNTDEFQRRLAALIGSTAMADLTPRVTGGTTTLTRDEILKTNNFDADQFFTSRHSIRHFSDKPVSLKVIRHAARLAQYTPSVCNRQASKVYVFSDDDTKKKLLEYQNGNRGFGHQIDKLLIVTTDLQHFLDVGERNQGWIDGGMFAMSLVYALHAMGLGTCCLNWSVDCNKDTGIRDQLSISETESIIMFIAVGHLPETLKVASSQRKAIDDVFVEGDELVRGKG